MSKSPRPLGTAFEVLEARDLPTAFGIPWADPGHVTLSFTPDNTPTPRGPSALGATLADAGSTAAWQREVLRAFQTWAAVTNVNVGLVGDGGQALGTSGAVQGDARFGDVRVAAAPLAGGALASALPFGWSGSTFGGDVLFNSAAPFGLGASADAFDLYSVALHEAGHVFGLDHDDHADSVMGAEYEPLTGLSADEVADIRALYGARTPDAYDAAGGNDTTARASAMRASGLLGRVVADGDLTTTADVDVYKFTTLPTLGLTSVTLRLQAAGLSLLTAKVTVTDAAGRVVASSVTRDPLNNDLTLRFNNSLFGGTFYAKVEGATDDVFGIGAYRLTADTINLTVPLAPLSGLLSPLLDGGLNDTLAAATDLGALLSPPTDARFDATFRGAIEGRSDVDTYKLRAPAGTGPVNLNVLVWGTNSAALDPRVRVYDAAGAPVAFRVLANDAGVFSAEVRDAVPGATYYVAVSSDAGATGGYFLGADFNHFLPTEHERVAAGTVAPAAAEGGTLTVDRGGIYQFALSADALGGAGGVVTMTVTDAAGRVVLALESAAGRPPTTAVRYLDTGTYTVRYATRFAAGVAPSSLGYGLFLLKLSDDVGPSKSSTTTRPSPTTTTTTTTTTSPPPPAPAPAPSDSTGSADAGSYYYYPTGGGYTYDGSSTKTTTATPYYF